MGNLEKLSAKQKEYLNHIRKKGFGAYQKADKDLDEMVEMGLLSKDNKLSMFDEVVYRPIY